MHLATFFCLKLVSPMVSFLESSTTFCRCLIRGCGKVICVVSCDKLVTCVCVSDNVSWSLETVFWDAVLSDSYCKLVSAD